MNNKKIIVLIIMLFNIIAVYTVVFKDGAQDREYTKLIKKADKYYSENLYIKSIDNYTKAMNVKDSVKIRVKMLKAYRKGYENGEYEDTNSYGEFAEDTLDTYYKSSMAYEKIASDYYDFGEYQSCADVIKQAAGKKLLSKKIKSVIEKIKDKYSLDYSGYSMVKSESDEMHLARYSDTYMFLNKEGSQCINGEFVMASSFAESLSFVKNSDYTMVINNKGVRQLYLDDKIESSSGPENGMMSVKIGDEYFYYDMSGKKVSGPYSFAGKFRNNVAAIQEGKEWNIVNTDGKKISKTSYSDIIVNDNDECAAKGCIFAKKDKEYQMLYSDLSNVNNFTCSDADPFVTDEPAAFEKDGKWGFVDYKGKVVIEPQYEEAKSFSNGYAGYKSGDKWGFINAKGEVKIEPIFDEVEYFGENGMCFVKAEGNWRVMKLYYME